MLQFEQNLSITGFFPKAQNEYSWAQMVEINKWRDQFLSIGFQLTDVNIPPLRIQQLYTTLYKIDSQ